MLILVCTYHVNSSTGPLTRNASFGSSHNTLSACPNQQHFLYALFLKVGSENHIKVLISCLLLVYELVPVTGATFGLRNFAPWFLRIEKQNFGMVVLHGNVKKNQTWPVVNVFFVRQLVSKLRGRTPSPPVKRRLKNEKGKKNKNECVFLRGPGMCILVQSYGFNGWLLIPFEARPPRFVRHCCLKVRVGISLEHLSTVSYAKFLTCCQKRT